MIRLSKERVRELLDYNPGTGRFTNRTHRGPKAQVGQTAGTITRFGYVVICLYRQRCMAHALAWLYVHGEWPKEIDHRDGCRSNNALTNLRLCTRSQNHMNAKRPKDNTSGYKGVSFHKASGKWRAYLRQHRKQTSLGYFSTPESAWAARKIAARQVFGEFERPE